MSLSSVTGSGLPDLTPLPGATRADRVADVAQVVLHRVHLPLREPFIAAHGVERDRQVVLVQVVGADGRSGWGECSALRAPTYTAEYTDAAWAHLRDRLVPAVLSGEPAGPETGPMAWTALDTAVTDLRLRANRRSLVSALGGGGRDVAVTAVIGGGHHRDALLALVGERVTAGYQSVKLKITPCEEVIDDLRAVRQAHPAVALAADANGSFDLTDTAHVRLLDQIDALGLAYIEQPLPARSITDLAELARRLSTPVALDESVGNPGDAEGAARTGSAFVLNVKPARVGGLAAARRCLAIASGAGWPVFVGGLLETGVGRAMALAVAAVVDARSNSLPSDLGPSHRYFERDLTEPIEMSTAGRVVVPTGPGLGVTPIEERVRAFTVDRTTIVR
jgi:o-succinylbenzoate synthase